MLGREHVDHLTVEITAQIARATVLGTGLQIVACCRVVALGEACWTHNVFRWVVALCVGHAPTYSVIFGGSTIAFAVLSRLRKVPVMRCDLRLHMTGKPTVLDKALPTPYIGMGRLVLHSPDHFQKFLPAESESLSQRRWRVAEEHQRYSVPSLSCGLNCTLLCC